MKKFFENVRKLSSSSSSSHSHNFNLRRLSLSSIHSMPEIKVIRGGYNIDLQKVDSKFTKLHKAVYLNNEDRVKKYLGQFNVNSVDNYNRTPLHFAAVNGNIRIIKILIAAGANLNIQDADGRTALIKAIECECNNEIVKILLNAGANVDLSDYDRGNTALHHCLLNANLECALYIIRNTLIIDYKKRNHKKETFLHLVAKIPHLYPVIEELIANGIEIEAIDELGRTAEEVAKLHNNYAAEKLIRKYVDAKQNQDNNQDDDENLSYQIPLNKTDTNNLNNDNDDLTPVIYDNIEQSIVTSSKNNNDFSIEKDSNRLNIVDRSLDSNFRNHYRFSGFFEDAIIEENLTNNNNVDNDVKENIKNGTEMLLPDSIIENKDEEPLYSNCDQSTTPMVKLEDDENTVKKENIENIQPNDNETQPDTLLSSDNMSDLDEMLNKDLNNDIANVKVKSNIDFDNFAIYSKEFGDQNNVIDGDNLTDLSISNNDLKESNKKHEENNSLNRKIKKKASLLIDETNKLMNDNDDLTEKPSTAKSTNNRNVHFNNLNQSPKQSLKINDKTQNINPKPVKSYAEAAASPKKDSKILAQKTISADKMIRLPEQFVLLQQQTKLKNASKMNNNFADEKNLRTQKGKFSRKKSNKRSKYYGDGDENSLKLRIGFEENNHQQVINNNNFEQNNKLNYNNKSGQINIKRNDSINYSAVKNDDSNTKLVTKISKTHPTKTTDSKKSPDHHYHYRNSSSASSPSSSMTSSTASSSSYKNKKLIISDNINNKSDETNPNLFADDVDGVDTDDVKDNNNYIKENIKHINIQTATAASTLNQNHDNKYKNLINSLKNLLADHLTMDQNNNNNNDNETIDDIVLLKCISKMICDSKQYQLDLEMNNNKIYSLENKIEILKKQIEKERHYCKSLETKILNNMNDNSIDVHSTNNTSVNDKTTSLDHDGKILLNLIEDQHKLKIKHYETILQEQINENSILKNQCHFLKELIQVYELSIKNRNEELNTNNNKNNDTIVNKVVNNSITMNKDLNENLETSQINSLTFLFNKFDEKISSFNEINQQRIKNIDEELRLLRSRSNFMQQFKDEIANLKFFQSQLAALNFGTMKTDSNDFSPQYQQQSPPLPSTPIQQHSKRRHSEQIEDLNNGEQNFIKGNDDDVASHRQKSWSPTKLSPNKKSISMLDLVNLDYDYNGNQKTGNNDESITKFNSTGRTYHRSGDLKDGSSNSNIDYSNSFSYKSKYFQSKINELRKQLRYVN